ncbi:MAG: serine protease [Gammaproteobacteria bacterium]|nr:MAG: serine protease [Gammaproteobacteria bacterium]
MAVCYNAARGKAAAPVAGLLLAGLSACGGGGGGSAPQGAAPAAPPAATGFTVSGTISVPEGTAVDGDLNDPSAAFAFNNQPASAQVLPVPVTLGGYVNVAGTGASGRSQALGDTSDFYRVNLLAGQTVTLLLGEPAAADLDLYLWNAAGTQVLDASLSTTPSESLSVAADGQYLVEVFAASGASTYVLSIGQPQPALQSGARLSDAFVPGELILRYRDQAAASSRASPPPRPGRAHLFRRGGAAGRALLMRVAAQARRAASRVIDHRAALPPASQAKWDTLVALKDLAGEPDVAYASPNFLRRVHAQPNDSAYGVQWHYPLINLPAAWDLETGSPAVTVAVIDTGILGAHPDLQGRLLPGYDFISDPANAADGDGLDPDPTDPGDGGGVAPSSFHGTHVAGTIGAVGNNGVGVAGVAWNVRLMPLRVCGVDGCALFDILQAARYAAGLPNDSGRLPAAPADIINLSLGGPSFSQAAADLYAQLRQAGILIVASAGNEANSAPSYPAAHQGVISVSAVGIDRVLASYSSFGGTVDVAAPGGDGGDLNGDGYPDFVLSTGGDDSSGAVQMAYTFLAGTSMASPHVAGVFALMKSANPNLGADEIEQMLVSGQLTDDIGAPGRDNLYGHGLINAQKAVSAALNASGNPPPAVPLLEAQPAALNFGTTMTALGFTAFNAGGGSLELQSVGTSASWLSVQGVTTGADGLGDYLAIVDRHGLAEGSYSATITLTADANSVDLPVQMQVTANPISPDAGFLYILLLDPATGLSTAQVEASASNGQYRYSFSGVAAGDYEIIAGTDADNDFVICDPGEACGQYLNSDQPLTISVGGNLAGIDFPVGYVLSLSSQAAGPAAVPPRPARRRR